MFIFYIVQVWKLTIIRYNMLPILMYFEAPSHLFLVIALAILVLSSHTDDTHLYSNGMKYYSITITLRHRLMKIKLVLKKIAENNYANYRRDSIDSQLIVSSQSQLTRAWLSLQRTNPKTPITSHVWSWTLLEIFPHDRLWSFAWTAISPSYWEQTVRMAVLTASGLHWRVTAALAGCEECFWRLVLTLLPSKILRWIYLWFQLPHRFNTKASIISMATKKPEAQGVSHSTEAEHEWAVDSSVHVERVSQGVSVPIHSPRLYKCMSVH